MQTHKQHKQTNSTKQYLPIPRHHTRSESISCSSFFFFKALFKNLNAVPKSLLINTPMYLVRQNELLPLLEVLLLQFASRKPQCGARILANQHPDVSRSSKQAFSSSRGSSFQYARLSQINPKRNSKGEILKFKRHPPCQMTWQCHISVSWS
ncbi:hypothetical protein HS088_TW08G00817 [Tripterygium wilfordii]|uniref:Uncharacterized protein n=1 Tax=Tripterygium wilfordii TaxID=458696 RepID=A0A7J7DD73_TRIWF|nr:hypothetical protein HS088_TW08G00817 [Tripterygium wilfordii]